MISAACRRAWIAIVLVGATATVILVAVSTRGQAQPSLPPGVTAGVSILDIPAATPKMDARVRSAIDLLAHAGNTDATSAFASVRLLRRGLGSDGSDLYGFQSESGSPCVVLIGHAGFCARSPDAGTPGLHWALGGATAQSPGRLLGIASDDVSGVSLEIDGSAVPVSLADNVVYAEFPNGDGEATVHVTRTDGRSTSFTVSLDG